MQRAVSGLLTELEKIKNLSDLAIQQKEYGDSMAHQLSEFLNSCEKFNTLYAPESIIETIGKGNNSLQENICDLQTKISDLGISQSTLQNELTNLSVETSTSTVEFNTKLSLLQRCCSDILTELQSQQTLIYSVDKSTKSLVDKTDIWSKSVDGCLDQILSQTKTVQENIVTEISELSTDIENKGTKSMARMNILIVLAALNLLAILSLIIILVL